MEKQEAIKIKILMIGDSRVGKTSIKNRFINNEFRKDFLSTIGMDTATKEMTVGEESVKVEVTDVAGQERFRSLSTNYLRNKNGFFLVFDVSIKESFDNIEYWLKQIANTQNNAYTTLIIVGNKIDKKFDENYDYNSLESKPDNYPRIITTEEGEKLAQKCNAKYFETSALYNKGINEAYDYLVKEIYKKIKLQQNEISKTQSHKLKNDNSKKSKCCNK